MPQRCRLSNHGHEIRGAAAGSAGDVRKRHRVDHRRALADFANGEGNQMTSHWLQVAYVVAPPGVTLTPVAGLVHP